TLQDIQDRLNANPNSRQFDQEDLAFAKDLVENNRVKSKVAGAKYKVTLAPNEDEYLLWDKPLSEQSEKVQESVKLLNRALHDSSKKI
ncbi:hypothetical protein LAJ57_13075, partial [Streptococcus pneumoniae]|uniref:hypothetical protein n=1 Tax=Streptococcus pneumoniae TaxID=1313 RepID=UPI001CBFB8AE